MAKKAKAKSDTGANLGFEAKLWLAADKMRNNMDAAEYKHVVRGLIFLRYISDAFEQMHQKPIAGEGEYEGADPEDPDDLKVEEFKPEFAGKMSFYLTAVDETLANPTNHPAIGLILCKERNKTIVEYTLRDATKPVGVATYSMVPPKLRGEFPTKRELNEALRLPAEQKK